MCTSSDEENEYLFLCSKQGMLKCVDAAGMCVLTETDLSVQYGVENTNITYITSSLLKTSLHLIACLTKTG